jgi:hypothetical protein
MFGMGWAVLPSSTSAIHVNAPEGDSASLPPGGLLTDWILGW